MPDTSPLPSAPGPDDFRALARSSPWRFGTLHFTHRAEGEPVEAWLERPGHLEVLARGERHVETGVPYSRSMLYLEEPRVDKTNPPVRPPQSIEPARRADGLVLERPFEADYDDPMWEGYRWVAMLDPVEVSHGVEVSEVHSRERFGRLTWTATCRPTPASSEDFGDGYDPRCSCCPLLFGAVSQDLEAAGGGHAAPEAEVAGYPSAYWVSLDVETGIVVDVEPQDGERTNTAFSNEIHKVGPLA